VTPTQLERWRSGGYLPRNSRRGLGRGAGSRSESVAGLEDYVEALVAQAGQGRSMHQTMLALFMAGVLQPVACSAVDPLMSTYEAAIRHAFRKEIDEGDPVRDKFAAADSEESIDEASKRASKAAKRHIRSKLRLERAAADFGGFQAQTLEELTYRYEQAVTSSAGLIPPDWVYSDDDRDFKEIWDNGYIPLDADICAQPPCGTCEARTEHMPTSRQGQHDILDSVCFCELDRARAIGGAVTFLVANLRDSALQDPDDPFLQAVMALCSNTVFRFMLREHRKLAPWRSESIVPCTLFFLHDCRWLKVGARVLTQVALWKIPSANGDATIPATVVRAMCKTIRKNHTLRSEDGVAMLLSMDGTVKAAELLKLIDVHHE
jgi:hypothetical protein